MSDEANRTSIEIDASLALASGVGPRGGVTAAQIDAASASVNAAIEATAKRVRSGELGFWDLPTDDRTVAALDSCVAKLPNPVDEVLVLGIGGSSLGAKTLLQALGGPPETRRARGLRNIHFLDNSDPWRLSSLLATINPATTLAIAVSKSGGTVETAAQMLVVEAWLSEALGQDLARLRWVYVTDPQSGALRQLAEERQIRTLSIPSNVGGRFSVLTAAGLLPTRLAGIEGAGILRGAATMAKACGQPFAGTAQSNPAAYLALLHVLHHRELGHELHVMMPYSDALRPFAAWFVQLWAESLGKRLDRQGQVVECGPTPLPAVGATDQHSQLQLFAEGPRNKLITMIDVAEAQRDELIPASDGPFAYLGGQSLHALLRAEARGTAAALAEDGRPSLTLGIRVLTAEAIGELLFLCQAATAIAGELYGVNAFDQPGVELAKRYASGLMGRPGYEADALKVLKLRGESSI